jgi:hypothetical protein
VASYLGAAVLSLLVLAICHDLLYAAATGASFRFASTPMLG